ASVHSRRLVLGTQLGPNDLQALIQLLIDERSSGSTRGPTLRLGLLGLLLRLGLGLRLGLLRLLFWSLRGRGLLFGLGLIRSGLLGGSPPVSGGKVAIPAARGPIAILREAELHLAALVRRDTPLVGGLGGPEAMDVLARRAIVARHGQLQHAVAVVQLEDVLDRSLAIRTLADHRRPVMVLQRRRDDLRGRSRVLVNQHD